MRPVSGDIPQTTLDYTGQQKDATGLLFYNARYYDPALGRFLSADSLVPGTADGKGGGAATLGRDDTAALRPLAVDFHEPGFVGSLRGETQFIQEKGFWFQLSDKDKRDGEGAKWQWGPQNPQALDRYSYVLNNPLRYTDPTGHERDCPEGWNPSCSRVINNSNQPVVITGDRNIPRPGCDVAVDGDNCFVWTIVLYPGEDSVALGFTGVDFVRAVDGTMLDGFDPDVTLKLRPGVQLEIVSSSVSNLAGAVVRGYNAPWWFRALFSPIVTMWTYDPRNPRPNIDCRPEDYWYGYC